MLTLREARAESGKTAQEIAQAIGCHRTTLYSIERGAKQPNRELARKIFEFYKGRVSLGMIHDPEFAGQVRAA